MANQYMKKIDIPLIIKDTQIKTVMSCHLIPVRVAIRKQTESRKLELGHEHRYCDMGCEYFNQHFSH